MSNFTPDQLQQFILLLKTCQEIGIKTMIMDKRKVRASADDKRAVIVQSFDHDLFSGPDEYEIAMARIPIVAERLNLVVDRSPDIELIMADGKKYYRMLKATSKSHSFDLRFAEPGMLVDDVPRGIRGTVAHTIVFPQAVIKDIVDANRVFAPENVWVHSSVKGTRVEMFDPAVGEKISIQITEEEEITIPISYKYASDVFIRLLSQKKDVEAEVLSNGILKINYKGLEVAALRREE